MTGVLPCSVPLPGGLFGGAGRGRAGPATVSRPPARAPPPRATTHHAGATPPPPRCAPCPAPPPPARSRARPRAAPAPTALRGRAPLIGLLADTAGTTDGCVGTPHAVGPSGGA